ncbi:zinc finger protein 391 isoform X1 [Eurytemora carolleeae]|uniref:zinc finger protein 391 isoform X1 n=1 Tax=Eurytemora carolleeae TaxID=1294199 RepID=UPI000C76E78B|nr:zinc finger protein 391 isoform X1 [Eurytemora carolleeae]|eukprot:XP_023324363.1 zinc finger protein 391-like isoform X1 [Eurytemora affinis]
MELPFEELENDLLMIQRFKLNKYIQDIKPVSQGNQVLKKIMIDLLELQFTMEDNLLLIKELKCFHKEKDKQKTILNTARQQITSIGSVNQLGTTWIQVSDNIESTPAAVNIDDERKPEQDIGMNVVENFIAVEEIKYPLEGDSISLIKEEGIPFGGGNLLPCEDAFSVGDETLMARGGEFPLPGERPPLSLMEEHACISNMKEEDNLKDVERLGDGYQCELCNYKGASLCKLKLHNSRTHETEEEVDENCLTPGTTGLDDERKPEQDIGMNVVENFIAVEEIKYPLEGDSISLIKEEGIPFGGGNLLPCEDAFSVGDETLMARGGEFPLPGERPPLSLMEEHACISNMKEEDNLKDVERLGGEYQCELCNYKGASLCKLKLHNSRTHEIEEEGPKPCDECDRVLSNAKALKRHKLLKHDTNGGGKCDQCGFIGRNKRASKYHMNNCHSGIHFMCDQCKYVGKSKERLKAHIRGAHDGQTFMCDKCEYVTNWSSRLNKHIKFKHNGVNFPCDQCNYVAENMAHLKVHKTTQHEPPTYFCELCDYAATLPRLLQAHIESAHEKIRYPCNLCDHASTSASNLRQHKRRVHKMKPEETFEETNPIKM